MYNKTILLNHLTAYRWNCERYGNSQVNSPNTCWPSAYDLQLVEKHWVVYGWVQHRWSLNVVRRWTTLQVLV